MAIFFVDLENVHSSGLEGIEKLGEKDRVFIFYTVNSQTLTVSAHLNIMNSPADIRYTEVSAGGKNALDFQLSTFLGRCTAVYPDNSFFIISSDTGYDFVKSFWLSKDEFSGSKIYRVPNLQKAIERISSDEKALLKKKALSAPKAENPDNIPVINDDEILSADRILAEEENILLESIKTQNEIHGMIAEAESEQKTQILEELDRITKEISADELNAVDELLSLEENIPLDIVQFRKSAAKNKTAEEKPAKKDTAAKEKQLNESKILQKISAQLNDEITNKNKIKHVYHIIKKSADKKDFYCRLASNFSEDERKTINRLIGSEFQNIKSMM